MFATPSLRTKSLAFLLASLLVLSACNQTPSLPSTEAPHAFNAWLDAEFARYLNFVPLAKSRLGDKTDNDKLNYVSEAARAALVEWRLDSVNRMQARFDRSALSAEDARSFDLWQFLAEQEVQRYRFRRHEYLFGRRGPNTRLPRSLINDHKVDNEADLKAYIARLAATGRYFDQYMKRVRLAAADGIRAPYFSYDVAIGHIDAFLAGQPFVADAQRDNVLWADAQSKTQALVDANLITAAAGSNYLEQIETLLLDVMGPAYQRLQDLLRAQRAEVDERAQGVSALPDGEAYYRFALARMTTTDLSAQEIHAIGRDEVTRIHALMREIAQQVQFDGDLTAFFEYMRQDERFFLPSTDAGRAQYLEQARAFLAGIETRLPRYFGLLPKAPLEVRRVEAYREQAGGAAHYMRSTPDGSRPGVFYAHLVDMAAVPFYSLETLAYHEGLPGHHLQIAIAQELQDVPRFRTYHSYTAYSEGWGLYAEYLGKDMGLFTDPYNDFGRLSGELWRAIRLVVDTGIHAQGWSEQQAIEYALTNSPRPLTSVRSEVRRYFESPAQATAYKIGMLKIIELRNRARDRLGPDFDYRAFHDQVLGSGGLPMALLERKIDAWLAIQR
ncbi:MAG: DUF885 domain-containing protein [Pseudomonadota bacterium]